MLALSGGVAGPVVAETEYVERTDERCRRFVKTGSGTVFVMDPHVWPVGRGSIMLRVR
ncbi:hypothetical protein [Amycolatopsis sp. NPDC004378]